MNAWNDRNQAIINEYRENGGKVGGRYEGKSLLLLHTLGAKSHSPRINPVAYVTDGDRYVVIASKGGSPNNPDWYYNVLANPLVTIEVGNKQMQAKADLTQEPERTRLYNKMTEMMASFADYKQKTDRVIPVFVLTPVK